MSLPNKVPQVPKCPNTKLTQCLKCPSAQVPKCPNVKQKRNFKNVYHLE